MNLSIRILIGLTLGLAMGVIASVYQSSLLITLSVWSEPVGKLWVNSIRMTVIPLLMALLITSIAGQKSTNNAARLGAKSLGFFVIAISISSFMVFVLAPPLLSIFSIDPQASKELLAGTQVTVAKTSELPPFRDWLIGLVPTNPIKAAADNAILPLLVFIGLFAATLLRIKKAQRDIIVSFFDAVKDAMFVLITWIMNLAPYGVFALVFSLSATLGLSAITALGSFILIACGLIILVTLLLYPLAIIVGRLPATEFIKFIAPVQVIGFSTRSSLAALPATIDATEKLGISNKTSGVVLPFAVTLFKFASPPARITGTYFIASLYGIELGYVEMMVIAIAISVLSFYSPGIPSGGLLIMSPVYLTLGLPVEGIGLLIAVDLIIDMFITASNVTANITAAAVLSRVDR
ncbi:MAG: dicarboxylate/amino acid:cation symporter [Proteobacteria bacterium]|nr:dicarboxylate/amino acid:cation symporter [Pseudomonadota bacterium]